MRPLSIQMLADTLIAALAAVVCGAVVAAATIALLLVGIAAWSVLWGLALLAALASAIRSAVIRRRERQMRDAMGGLPAPRCDIVREPTRALPDTEWPRGDVQ